MYGFAYGKTASLSIEALKAADNALKSLYNFETKIHFIQDLDVRIDCDQVAEEKLESFVEEFDKCIHNNLDMPKAMEVVWNFVKFVNLNLLKISPNKVIEILLDFDKVLGFGFSLNNPISQEIIELGKQRFSLKQSQKYEEADSIRDKIEEKGYYLEENKEYFVINRYHG